MRLSIILPVYNVEKYIEKCMDSLITQKNLEYEVIVVNDGTMDNSMDKIQKYILQYPHIIKVINQENKGLGAARNTGIRYSKGEYITFVDSDDYLIPNIFGNIFDVLNKEFDLFCFSLKEVEENNFIFNRNSHIKQQDIFQLSNIQLLKYFFLGKIPSFSCAKIYHRNLFEQSNILFSENRYFEDMRVTFELLAKSDKIFITPYEGYAYVQRSNSITKTFSEKHLSDFLIEYKLLLNKIDSSIKLECSKEIEIYKVLQFNSLNRILYGLNSKNNRFDSMIIPKISIFTVLLNSNVNLKDRIFYLATKNFRLIKFGKKIKNIFK